MNTQSILSHDLAIKRVITNCMDTLSINKVVVHTSNKQIIKNKKNAIPSQLSLSLITGQKPKSVYSKKAVAVFQLRKKQFLGWKLTLRKLLMQQFLQKLVLIGLPQQREFNGLYNYSIDNNGNCHLGYTQLLVFPELDFHFNILSNLTGINITIISNSKNKQETCLLLTGNQIPIKSK